MKRAGAVPPVIPEIASGGWRTGYKPGTVSDIIVTKNTKRLKVKVEDIISFFPSYFLLFPEVFSSPYPSFSSDRFLLLPPFSRC